MFITTHDTTQTTQSGHCLDQANILTVLDHHTRWQSNSPRDPGTAGPGCVWASQQPRPPRLRVPYLWLLGLKSWFSAPQKSARTTNGKGLGKAYSTSGGRAYPTQWRVLTLGGLKSCTNAISSGPLFAGAAKRRNLPQKWPIDE